MTTYSVTIDMPPFGKARPRVTKNGTYMPPEYVERREMLKWHCRDMPDVESRMIALDICGVRPMPKSWSKKKRAELDGMPTTAKPDVDNFAGAVMDALLVEDSNVVDLHVSKIWGQQAQIIINVSVMSDEAAPF